MSISNRNNRDDAGIFGLLQQYCSRRSQLSASNHLMNLVCRTSGLLMPIWEYGRGEGISVTGGFVYRGPTITSLKGKYIFADYGTGNIWALDPTDVNNPVVTKLAASDLHIASFGVDQNNELYICAFDGKIHRFEE